MRSAGPGGAAGRAARRAAASLGSELGARLGRGAAAAGTAGRYSGGGARTRAMSRAPAADKLLASLNSQLSQVSLEEAQKAVAEAQKVLANLRDQAAEAERAVAKASKDVAASKKTQNDGGETGSGKQDQYADKSFWDKRYVEGKCSEDGLYEWYLSFDEWKPHLLSHIAYDERSEAVLVAGCGNSGLCEDLSQAGLTNVAGFDYSPAVVTAMRERCVKMGFSSTVRYFEGDARDLKTEESDSYSFIVDKGTLDAIASGGESSTGAEQHAVCLYMLEVWRLLKPLRGKFLVLSTMPPQVFYTLAIEPLLVKGSGTDVQQLCDWDGGAKQSLKTAEGGEVFSYSISKMASPSKAQRSALAATRVVGSADNKGPSRDGIMAGIQALLEEAKQAKMEMDVASAKCTARTAEARDALSSLSTAEREKSKLEERLKQTKQELEKGVGGEREEEMQSSMNLDTMGSDAQTSQSQSQAPPPPPPPPSSSTSFGNTKVTVEILSDESNLVAGGHASVEYTLQEGAWADGDAIYLVCVASSSSSLSSTTPLYKPTDGEVYDQLEYTVEPVSTSQGLLGRVKISLPTFCSHFAVQYVRTIVEIRGNATVERRSKSLAQSDVFLVTAPVQQGYPDGAPHGSLSKPQKNIFFIPQEQQTKCLRRRGAGSIEFSGFSCTIEDLQSIKTISFSFQLTDEDATVALTRVMAWATTSSSSEGCVDMLSLTIEADLARIDKSCDGGTVVELRTQYAHSAIPHLPPGIRFNLVGAQVELGKLGRGGEGEQTAVNVVCRIPYVFDEATTGHFLLATDGAAASSKSKSKSSLTPTTACGFCGNELVASGKISQVHQLPSGLLDNVMHEFICSEASPTMTLCMSDLTTPQGSLLVGPLHANANPADVTPGSVILACKESPTLLDLFSGQGGALATAPLADESGKAAVIPSSALVNIDTCLITCARCGSYVGDGQIGVDCPCPTHPAEEVSSTGTTKPAVEEFVLTDLRDVRFAKHCVELSLDQQQQQLSSDKSEPLLLREGTVSSEQAVARIVYHLNAVFTVSTFLLYVPLQPTVIVLRVLGRDYAVSLSADQGLFREAIKVSFRIGNKASLKLAGTEARIALQPHEMQHVSKLLAKRSRLFGPSIFAGQSLSFLNK